MNKSSCKDVDALQPTMPTMSNLTIFIYLGSPIYSYWTKAYHASATCYLLNVLRGLTVLPSSPMVTKLIDKNKQAVNFKMTTQSCMNCFWNRWIKKMKVFLEACGMKGRFDFMGHKHSRFMTGETCNPGVGITQIMWDKVFRWKGKLWLRRRLEPRNTEKLSDAIKLHKK